MHDLFLHLHAIRQHVISQYILVHIDGIYCKESAVSNITMQSMSYLHNV